MRPSAEALYRSVQRFLELDDHVQVWPGHGAGSACGKALGAVPQTTIGYERMFNGAIDAARRGEDAFVESILDGQPEPPLYFARMKALNRDGVPALAALPTPRPLAPDDARAQVGRRHLHRRRLPRRGGRCAAGRRDAPGGPSAPRGPAPRSLSETALLDGPDRAGVRR